MSHITPTSFLKYDCICLGQMLYIEYALSACLKQNVDTIKLTIVLNTCLMKFSVSCKKGDCKYIFVSREYDHLLAFL